jgi:methionyl-tRNA synthetase
MLHYTAIAAPFSVGILAPLILAAVVWTLILKGFALWYAARGNQRGWFIALLIINTLGILEIIYLIWFRPKNDSHSPSSAPMSSSSSAQ